MQMPQKPPFSAAQWCRYALILLSLAAALLFWGKILRDVMGILFGAVVIAFFLVPLCRLMERRLRRPLSALIALLLALALLLCAACFLLPRLMRQLMLFADLLPSAMLRISNLVQNLLQSLQNQLPGFRLPQMDLSQFGGSMREAARSAAATISGLAGGLYRGFLMAVLSYFLLADRERILLHLELLMPLKWRRQAVRAGSILARQLRLYLRGQATIALAVGSLAGFAMLILNLPGAFALGMAVGACNVIPYFGPILGGIPAVITALSISWQRALMAIAALFLVQQADGMLISPRVMGNITGFSPAVVLIALFAGARIGGVGAMLLTLPILMAIRTVYRVFVQQREKN